MTDMKVSPMDLDQDWKQAMTRAGCSFMNYVQKVQRETKSDNPEDIYEIIAVYLEKEYPAGTLRIKVEVDVAFLSIQKRPEVGLCRELLSHINAMDIEASKQIEEGI